MFLLLSILFGHGSCAHTIPPPFDCAPTLSSTSLYICTSRQKERWVLIWKGNKMSVCVCIEFVYCRCHFCYHWFHFDGILSIDKAIAHLKWNKFGKHFSPILCFCFHTFPFFMRSAFLLYFHHFANHFRRTIQLWKYLFLTSRGTEF